MKTKSHLILLYAAVGLIVFCPSVLAHNLWLNPGDYFPEVGATVDIGIGWGHQYPANRVDQEVKKDRVEAIKAVDPDGKTIDLSKVSAALYQLKIDKPGAYIVTAQIKPGFFTTTPQGRKWGNKKEIADPIKCTRFHLQAKTVLIAGGKDRNLTQPVGQALEIIPRTHFGDMKAGHALTIQALFEGKPLPDAAVKATYAGFQAEADTSHNQPAAKHEKTDKKGHTRHFPVETHTDAQGNAELPLEKAGYWMIMLSHRCPFADAQTCDEYMYNMAFTFKVPD
ncbi:MAG: DUF4198 domain-containing protein [Desulfatitalea sp.]|nr:DUF4198 domain-containing protein [Desulfatitalea sp.]NNJ99671.1 DUF4198 domain-containing protein [Desulfatitalea sp.]